MVRRARALDVVDAAYRLDLDDATWLRELTDLVEPLLRPETGTVSYFYDLAGPYTAVTLPYVKHTTLSRLQDAPTFHDPAQRILLMIASPASVISKLLPPKIYQAWASTSGKAMGIADSLGLCALDPSGKGVVLSVGFLAPVKLDPKRKALLSRLSIHIGTAHRLRRQLAGRAPSSVIDSADAVLTPDGQLAHATRHAKQPDARALLRRAVRLADRTRSRAGRRDEERALAAWKGLLDGRWSLIDQFDSDGRRFWVVRENAPNARDPRRLSERERLVLAYAAMGHTQKQIAYTLGLSLGTVGNHLRSGMDKLRFTSRVELVRYFSGAWLKSATPPQSNGRS